MTKWVDTPEPTDEGKELIEEVLKRPDWKVYELEGQDQGSELHAVPTVPERAAHLLDGVRETLRKRNGNRRSSRRKGR